MAKKTSTNRIITSPIHDELRAFSRKMVNEFHRTKEQVNTLKHVAGERVKESSTKIVNETGKAQYLTDTVPLLVKDTSNPDAIITTTNSDAVYLSNQKKLQHLLKSILRLLFLQLQCRFLDDCHSFFEILLL